VPPASVTIAFGHDLADLNLPINVFDGNPFPRQLSIKRLLLRCQRPVLALLKWHLTIGMIVGNSLIATVRLDLHIRTYGSPRAGFIKSKIMNTSFGLLDKDYQERIQIDHHLCLYSMTLLLAGIVLLLIFLGRSIGLSVTSTAIAFGFCTSVMSAFLPGKQNKPL